MDQAAVDEYPGLNAADRDALIRTVLTEGAQNDPQAWASVAAVVRNRLAAGGYGSSVSQIVKAPGQFEVWQNGRAAGVNPNSDAYQQAGRIVDAIAAGLPDPTNGATHFFSPAGQASLGRNAPTWGGRNVTAIAGGHVYSAPNGRVDLGITTDPQTAIPISAPTPQPQAKASTMSSDPLKRWGVTLDDDGSTSRATTTDTQPSSKGDTLSRWGVSLDDAPAASTPAQTTQTAPTSATSTGSLPPALTPVAAGDDAAAVGRGLINGVPVAGPYLLGGLNRVAAAARAITKGEPYEQALQEVEQFGDKTGEAHPFATGTSQAIGAGLSMVPLAAAAPVAFGVRGGTMASQMLTGGATNAALGAADATARGDNPLLGAGFGAAGGAAGPLIGKVGSRLAGGALSKLSDGYNALTNYLSTGSGSGIPGVGRAAAGMVNQMIDADGAQAVQNALARYGSDAMLADAGPSLTTIAAGLASKPGEAQNIVRGALNARAAGANDRIAQQIAGTVGPYPGSDKALDAAYKSIRSDFDSAAYPAIHANSPPVDANDVLDTIGQQLEHATGPQRAVLQRFQQELTRTAHTEPGIVDPETGAQITPDVTTWDSRTLHNLRQDLDSVIDNGDPKTGVQPGSLSRTEGAIGAMRQSLDGVLKTQVPGMAEADARSALNAENINAVKTGYGSVIGQNIPDPADFAVMRAGANPATNAAMNAGMASRVYRAFGTGTQRDAVTLNKLLAGGEDGFSAANLGTAFGEQPRNALLDTLAREKAFDETTQTVTRNSETARRTAANKLLDATEPGSLDLKNATPTGLALQAGKSAIVDPIVKMILESPEAPRNLEIARALSAQGASRDQIFAALQKYAGRQSAVSGASNALTGAVNAGLNRLLLAAGATYRPSFDPAR